jgi:multidrug transporter EmrE-like cation transporter
MTPLIPLGGSVLLNAAAQISLRYASSGRAGRPPASPRLWQATWAICFGFATLLWLAAIQRADISYAYPLLGAGYVLVTLLAKWLLSERISVLRWISIVVITAGVVMVGANR